MHNNITIKDNIIHSSQYNPLTVKNTYCSSLVIQNNTCVLGINNNTSSGGNTEGVMTSLKNNCPSSEALIVVNNT